MHQWILHTILVKVTDVNGQVDFKNLQRANQASCSETKNGTRATMSGNVWLCPTGHEYVYMKRSEHGCTSFFLPHHCNPLNKLKIIGNVTVISFRGQRKAQFITKTIRWVSEFIQMWKELEATCKFISTKP